MFKDFTNFDPATERFYTEPEAGCEQIKARGTAIPYPAPMMSVFILFHKLFSNPLQGYLAFLASSAVAATVWLMVSFRSLSVGRRPLALAAGVSLLLSYPFLFELERANAEGFVWVVVALGMAAFVARRHQTAGLLFGLAASMKFFPGVLLLLLLARRRYKEFVVSAAAILVFTLIGLRTLGPIPDVLAEVTNGLGRTTSAHLTQYRPDEIGYDHSLFAVVKHVLHFQYKRDYPVLNRAHVYHLLNARIAAVRIPYTLFVLTGFGLLYCFRIRKLPVLNQTMALMVLAVTLPYISGEYTLAHLYSVWVLFLLFVARDLATGRQRISRFVVLGVLGAFGLIFAMTPFGWYASVLKTLALMSLLLVSVTIPLRSSMLEEDCAAALEPILVAQ